MYFSIVEVCRRLMLHLFSRRANVARSAWLKSETTNVRYSLRGITRCPKSSEHHKGQSGLINSSARLASAGPCFIHRDHQFLNTPIGVHIVILG